MNKCFDCNEPATLVNYTQFAGTHYWCDAHVPPGDRADCTPLEQDQPNSTILDPANLVINFSTFGSQWNTKPTDHVCEVYYHDANGHYKAEATDRSAHRARMAALNDLETMVVNRAQEPQGLKPCWETRAAKVLRDNFWPTNPEYETTPPDTKPEQQPDRIQYLLDKLQEEAAEVVQAVSKIRRFGPHNHHPDRTTTNLEELTGELEDFQAIVWALQEAKYLDPQPSTTTTIRKYQALMG